MKTILFTLLLMPVLLIAQAPKMSQKSQQDLIYIQRNIPLILKGDKAVIDELPLVTINNRIYVSFIGKLKEQAEAAPAAEGIVIGKGVGRIRSIRVPLTELYRIATLNQLEYLELAGKIKPSLDKVLFDTRVDSVHAGLGLPASYTGKNVIIGVNDWGFDYTSPMFYDTLLQNSRILAAWDQFRHAGSTPADFSYGAEFNTPSQLQAAQCDTSNQLGYATHGTHVAGIAGGSGAGVIAKGMGFESEYLFTTILVDEAAALDSWYWMHQKAEALQKRLVVNMSWGLYHFGTNDGTSLLSQAIEEFTDQGVLFVSSAGNNGSVNFHFERSFNNDSIKSKINFYDYSLHDSLWGQSIHGWGETGKNFEVKIQVMTTSGTLLGQTAYYPTTMNSYDEGFIVVNISDTVWYNVAAQEAHPQNLKPTVRFRIKNKHTSLRIDLAVRSVEGTVHFWNLVELTTNGGNWGMPFVSMGTGYIGGNNLYGIGEPTCADDCISVASHAASYMHSNGVNILGGSRSAFSSIGPRNDGALKPEISAPGSSVLSSISSFTDDTYTEVTSVNFQGRDYPFARFSGTSMSSPAVAGICALIWEINPYLSPRQVKQIIIETARQDNHTGVIPAGGDTKWGYGKVNAMAAVKATLSFVGLEEVVTGYENNWSVYPNPATTTLSIEGFEQMDQVQLFDVSGKETQLNAAATSWSVQGLASGVYTVRVVANNRVYQKKVMIH